ncbi:hypothetical protein ACWEQ0_15220 [Nocardia thailandica]
MGELFPGQKLQDEGGEDSDGQTHRPRVDVDLEAGVIRVVGGGPAHPDQRAVSPQESDRTP